MIIKKVYSHTLLALTLTIGMATTNVVAVLSIKQMEAISLYDQACQCSNNHDALRLMEAAAELGHTEAQTLLGSWYYNGNGVNQDYVQAFRWFTKAAQQGRADAQYNLGVCYEQGKGTAKDPAAAVRWYTQAANQGLDVAQFSLGLCYQDAVGVDQDTAEAVRLFTLAANQGLAQAQYNLGCYYTNQGDGQQAFTWFSQAARRALPEAQFSLGVCYYHGQGVPQDKPCGIALLKKAAEQEQCDAQFFLAKHCSEAIGFDKTVAYLTNAAQNNNNEASKLLWEIGQNCKNNFKQKLLNAANDYSSDKKGC